MPNLGLEIKRRCGICGKMFIIKTLDSLYCCKKCSDVAYARKKRAEAREKQLALIAKSVPKVREESISPLGKLLPSMVLNAIRCI